MSGVGLEWLPTCNPKLKYSHAITHDATTLKGPRPTACCSRAAEIFNFRLIRSDSIARNFIFNNEYWCSFRSNRESDNLVPRVFSRVCVSECTTRAPFSKNELCLLPIGQCVYVGAKEPISVNPKWASDTCAYRNLSQKPFGYPLG